MSVDIAYLFCYIILYTLTYDRPHPSAAPLVPCSGTSTYVRIYPGAHRCPFVRITRLYWLVECWDLNTHRGFILILSFDVRISLALCLQQTAVQFPVGYPFFSHLQHAIPFPENIYFA